jgi:hypothetical protein
MLAYCRFNYQDTLNANMSFDKTIANSLYAYSEYTGK